MRKTIFDELDNRIEEEESAAIASLLKVAFSNTSETEERISEVRRLLKLPNNTIPTNLWRQFGQLIENSEEFYDLTVEVYERAAEVTSNQPNGYQYTVGPCLADAYVKAGMREKARESLLEAYAEIDFSADNQYNPGYGDYQELTSYESIAQKLVTADCKLDAIPIYAKALSNPKRFEQAKRWGGSRGLDVRFKSQLSEVIDALDEDDFSEYLSFKHANAADESGTDEESKTESDRKAENDEANAENIGFAFDLMPITPTLEMNSEASSVASLVVAKMAASEQGLEQLTEFDRLAAEKMEESPKDSSIIAIRLIIAIALANKESASPEAAAASEALARTCFEKLSSRLPEPESETLKTSDRDFLYQLYSPALLSLESESPAIREASMDFIDQVIALANRWEMSEIVEVMTVRRLKSLSATGGAKSVAALTKMLDAVAVATTPAKVVDTKTADECLRIGELAIQTESWEVLIEAIRRAIGGGPPLLKMGNDNSSAGVFMLQTRSSSVRSQQATQNLNPLITRIEKLLDAADEAIAEDPTLATAAYEALGTAVLPPERKGEVFPFAVSLVGSMNSGWFFDPKTVSKPTTASLSSRLVRYAVQADKTDDLAERLKERQETCKEADRIALLRIQLADGLGNDAEVMSGIDALMDLLGLDDLSDENTTAADPQDTPPGKLTVASANYLLHALLPLVDRESVMKDVQTCLKSLLVRAGQDGELCQSGNIWIWLAKNAVEDQRYSDEEAMRWIDLFGETIVQRYMQSNNSMIAQRQKKYAVRGFCNLAIENHRAKAAMKIYRMAMLMDDENMSQGADAMPNCSFLMALPSEERYQVVRDFFFGEQDATDSDEPQSLDDLMVGGIVRVLYSVPPESLADHVPLLDSLEKMSVVADDFPAQTIGLTLARFAADAKQSAELIERLQPFVKSAGDEVDAMVGLAHLFAGDTDAAAEALNRVSSYLDETRPKEDVKTAMPYESLVFAIRARDAGLTESRDIWMAISDHARFRQLGIYTGMVTGQISRSLPWPGEDENTATADEPLAFEEYEFDHWATHQSASSTSVVAASVRPEINLQATRIRSPGGVQSQHLLFKYPLAGDFAFRVKHRMLDKPYLYQSVGGIGYGFDVENQNTTAKMVFRRGNDLSKKADAAGDVNETLLRFAGDTVEYSINESGLINTSRSDAFPFVSILLPAAYAAEFGDIQFEGDVTIPDQVTLLNKELRGWYTTVFRGTLPTFKLNSSEEDETISGLFASQPTGLTWYLNKDQELRSSVVQTDSPFGSVSQSNSLPPKHLAYLRPLLDGESIEMDVYYDPETNTEVNPAIGRIAVLLRKDGV
ncbi:MAG: DUF1583 domain-containing protein, partial [Planctomycetota bacterium]